VSCRASARKFEVCRAGAGLKLGRFSIPGLRATNNNLLRAKVRLERKIRLEREFDTE